MTLTMALTAEVRGQGQCAVTATGRLCEIDEEGGHIEMDPILYWNDVAPGGQQGQSHERQR
jgi:hypothetical protein